jgi:pimeloyl-ACP methyl ester carboxylesterase
MTASFQSMASCTSFSRRLDIRGLEMHVREWRPNGASEDSPILFMLHGWMDVSATFQFVVDALRFPWRVVAPDWRGFGDSERSTDGPGVYGYWYPEYFADLEALLVDYGVTDESRAHLVGHSMGANIAGAYAGVRPERVASLVMLEGFGLHATQPEEAPARFSRWLDQLVSDENARSYATLEDLGARLRKINPRLDQSRALLIAGHWAKQDSDGTWILRADPAHQRVNPYLYRVDEMAACWRAVKAPVLWVEGLASDLLRNGDKEWRAELDRRMSCFAKLDVRRMEEAGHMLHHDQPEQLASLIEEFVLRLARKDA